MVEACDGDEAARLLDDLAPFDMLLTDVRMPGSRDGIALAAYARSRQSSIPVLVVSGHALDVAHHLAALESVVFLRKPYRMNEVVRVSKRLMLAACTKLGRAAL